MKRSPRNTPIRYQTSIVDGWLYFEDARQAEVGTDLFVDILEDKHTTSLRLVSLANDWFSHEWVTGVGIVDFDIKLEMTLRKEFRSGRAHWYAYRQVGGVLFKRYVGQSDRITTKKLVEVAKKLPGI